MPSVEVLPPPFIRPEGQKHSLLPPLLQTPAGHAILELQGTIHAPPPVEPSDGDDPMLVDSSPDTSVGKLVFPKFSLSNPKEDESWMKLVYLYVGKHQRLTGYVKKLPAPLGIMRNADPDEDGSRKVQIVEIVRYKIVFPNRPEPVGSEE